VVQSLAILAERDFHTNVSAFHFRRMIFIFGTKAEYPPKTSN